MERNQELQEFASALNALCKTYQVTLGVSIQDLKIKDNDPKEVPTSVQETPTEETKTDTKEE